MKDIYNNIMNNTMQWMLFIIIWLMINDIMWWIIWIMMKLIILPSDPKKSIPLFGVSGETQVFAKQLNRHIFG